MSVPRTKTVSVCVCVCVCVRRVGGEVKNGRGY